MSDQNQVLSLWGRFSGSAIGRWMFSRSICHSAPYFATIKPRVLALEEGLCQVSMRKRRRVHNHIRTVHAIAICNLAEMAAGVMCEATVPRSHRWIPKGMQVDYLKKADSDLVASAQLKEIPHFSEAQDLEVPVSVVNREGEEVVHARIKMWITPRQ